MTDLKRGAIEVTFPSDTHFVHMAINVARNAAVMAGFENSVAGKVAIATDEAVTNVIKHAYGGKSDKRITLKLDITPESLTIKILHTGKALTNEDIKLPVMKEYLKKKKPGGLGLYIMKQFMDEVNYSTGKEHCCQMTKYRKAD